MYSDIISSIYDYDTFMQFDEVCIFPEIAKLAHAESVEKHKKKLKTDKEYLLKFAAWRYYLKYSYIMNCIVHCSKVIKLSELKDNIPDTTRAEIIIGRAHPDCQKYIDEIFSLVHRGKLDLTWFVQ